MVMAECKRGYLLLVCIFHIGRLIMMAIGSAQSTSMPKATNYPLR